MWLLLACAPTDPDAALLASLQQAAASGTAPEALAASAPPHLSTLRPGERDTLRLADIAAAPGLPAPPPDLQDKEAVMYWLRSAEGPGDPQIVGLWWPGPELFYGVVLPP